MKVIEADDENSQKRRTKLSPDIKQEFLEPVNSESPSKSPSNLVDTSP